MTVRASNGDGAWCAHRRLDVPSEAVAAVLRKPGPHVLAAVCADCGAPVALDASRSCEPSGPVEGTHGVKIPVTPVDVGTIDFGKPTMRTFLVERMKRERIEVTICAATAEAMGGDWEAAATAAAEDRADWETVEWDTDVFDTDDSAT